MAGMWEFAAGNTFGATAFTSYGALCVRNDVGETEAEPEPTAGSPSVSSTGLALASRLPTRELKLKRRPYSASTWVRMHLLLNHLMPTFDTASWFVVTFIFLIAAMRSSAALVYAGSLSSAAQNLTICADPSSSS